MNNNYNNNNSNNNKYIRINSNKISLSNLISKSICKICISYKYKCQVNNYWRYKSTMQLNIKYKIGHKVIYM